MQDLLVALLKQGARLRAVEHPRAWLFTVLRRKARGLRLRERSLAPALAGSVEGDPTDRLALQPGDSFRTRSDGEPLTVEEVRDRLVILRYRGFRMQLAMVK